jgi:outer membrane receptor protein involved in Fe transport
MSRFEDRNRLASAVYKVHGLYSYDLAEDSRLSFSGGATDHDINISNGPSYDDGRTGFLRADWRRRRTSARVFWNRGRSVFRDQPVTPIQINYDTVDASAEQSLELPFGNSLTAGGAVRRNTARSNLFRPGLRDQTLLALFAENSWRASELWTFVGSARGDHHPFAGWQFAPRVSAIFMPSDEHSLRATAASAFRNPTLLENYFDLQQTFPVSSPPFTAVDLTVLPNQDLEPERIQFYELAHRGTFEALRTSLTGFYYRVTNLVRTFSTSDLTAPPVAAQVSRVVNAGETKALGGEAGAELALSRPVKVYANYAYVQLYDQNSFQTFARSAPKHKVNAGVRASRGPWSGSAELHWVDRTFWRDGAGFSEVRAYTMVNVAATRRFAGRWEGLELTVAGFNVADRHYEISPRQNGEIIAARWTGTVAYRFGLPR